jgi:hypothetical protein
MAAAASIRRCLPLPRRSAQPVPLAATPSHLPPHHAEPRSSQVLELCRGVRAQLQGLIAGLAGTDLTSMSLGLSHSLSRYKLKFSPDKVDTMIVQVRTRQRWRGAMAIRGV